jgi:hypothetical protein
VGTLISSDTLTSNFQVVHDQILAQTAGYVTRYEIVKEERLGDEFRVSILAEVGRDNLARSLEALGLLHRLKDRPKVMVVIDEKVAGLFGTTGSENVGRAEVALAEKLLAAGFTVVDAQTVRKSLAREKALQLVAGEPQAAALAGLGLEAQVVITGRAISKNAGGKLAGTNMQSLQATVQARAVRADDGRIIGTRTAQAARAHIDELTGGSLAIEQASREVADLLIADILAAWKREVYGRAQEITVVISGLVSFRHLTAVRKVLESGLEGVKGVHVRQFAEGTAELGLDYAGKSTRIAEELAERTFTGFRLEPTSVTPNRLDVRAIVER